MSKVDKKRIGLRVDEDFYNELENIANEFKLSVPQTIIFLLAQSIRTNTISKEILSSEQYSSKLKELAEIKIKEPQ